MCGFQIREPHDHVLCKDGRMHARYATFGTNNGKYYYLGIFTKGRTDAGKPDTFMHSKKMEVPDTVLSMQQII